MGTTNGSFEQVQLGAIQIITDAARGTLAVRVGKAAAFVRCHIPPAGEVRVGSAPNILDPYTDAEIAAGVRQCSSLTAMESFLSDAGERINGRLFR